MKHLKRFNESLAPIPLTKLSEYIELYTEELAYEISDLFISFKNCYTITFDVELPKEEYQQIIDAYTEDGGVKVRSITWDLGAAIKDSFVKFNKRYDLELVGSIYIETYDHMWEDYDNEVTPLISVSMYLKANI